MEKAKCQCCGEDLGIWTQPAMMPGKPDRTQGECHNKQCSEYMVTLLLVDGKLCNPRLDSTQARLMSTEGA